ncbi:MAG TPA: hypothetical protein VHT25_00575 [Solirubrobacteraceae bacterium]|jgi:hypothetical protein|nr:hypothetical protein [Solirubrobacteraceae bacterium]
MNRSVNPPPPEPTPLVDGSPRRTRLPSARAGAVLATVMLGAGIALGAAIGPAPEASLAGSGDVAQKLPALIAGAAARGASQTPAAAPAATPAPAEVTPPTTPAPVTAPASAAPAQATTPVPAPAETPAPASKTTKPSGASNVPPITSVWLIQLAGVSFAEALSNGTAAPSITGELLPKGTYLPAWSALSASGFANDAALVEHRSSLGATPPLLHSIVQPPCPEASTATCGAGTPGGLAAADAFLKATLATITQTTTYSEHGLVVVTFATVADPAGAELPPGASPATLASQPPAGAVLLSSFAKAGARSSVAFDPTSPKQSLEKLLH